MAYALTLGHINVVGFDPTASLDAYDCDHARQGCLPAFVFSVPGEVRFRMALRHLSSCRKHSCRQLRAKVCTGMTDKLRWLMTEHCLLGCVHVQPSLYGSSKVSFQRKRFPTVAHHLARCPRESCAQLRRALLLSIRDEVRVNPLAR